MLITKTLFILAFTYTVTSSGSEDDLDRQDFFVKSYGYNHPPLFEVYKDLTDTDNLEVRQVRQVRSLENEENEYTKSPKTLNTESDVPVTVVDNSKPDTVNSNTKLRTNNTINKTKRRKQRRRPNPIQSKEEVKVIRNEDFSDKKDSTESYPVTSPSPKTVVPKTFTKRPIEYNPIIKKIRHPEPVVKILKESNHVYSHNGNFHYSFEGADGTKVSSEGELKSFNDDKTGEAVIGSVYYKDDEGNDFSLSYTADENGYRPHGDHLPTPPPIPPAIARALKYLATKTTPQPVTEAITL